MPPNPERKPNGASPVRRERRPPEPSPGRVADVNRALRACWQKAKAPVARDATNSVAIALDEAAMTAMWLEHLAHWSYYFEPGRLEDICSRVQQGRRPTLSQMEYLKILKNTGDELRHFFQLFSVAHEVPPTIQSLVKFVGQLRDQVRLGQLKLARRPAHKLLVVLPKSGRVHWPKLRVDPPAKGRFLRARIARMRRALASQTLTAYQFHELKKDFRLVYSVYYYLHPEEARAAAGPGTFSGAKRLIKQMHRVLLEQKYRRGMKYRATPVRLPEDFRVHLLRFLGAIRITSRAGRRQESALNL